MTGLSIYIFLLKNVVFISDCLFPWQKLGLILVADYIVYVSQKCNLR